MKFAALFSTLTAAVSVLSVAALPAYPLEARTPAALASHLHPGGTFYRAVTGGELAHVSTIYKEGQHPASHTTVPGDFSHSGALYVFSVCPSFVLPNCRWTNITFQDIEEAKLWGSCWAKVQLKAENKKYYLVKFKYTPNSGLKTHRLVLIILFLPKKAYLTFSSASRAATANGSNSWIPLTRRQVPTTILSKVQSPLAVSPISSFSWPSRQTR